MSVNILFISEDDSFTFDMIGFDLEGQLKDGEVVTAFSAHDDELAYQVLSNHEMDMIIVDFDIQSMNCERFIDLINLDHRWLHIPIVVMSKDKFVERKAFELGIVDFFSKPIKTEDLLDKIYATLSPLHELQQNIENLNIQTKDELINILRNNIKYTSFLKESLQDEYHPKMQAKMLEVSNALSKNNKRILNYLNT
ncbi:MAG: response regulator [Campylobacterota bacterium]|nr:response regulator [Campylobacterota bacterium]